MQNQNLFTYSFSPNIVNRYKKQKPGLKKSARRGGVDYIERKFANSGNTKIVANN